MADYAGVLADLKAKRAMLYQELAELDDVIRDAVAWKRRMCGLDSLNELCLFDQLFYIVPNSPQIFVRREITVSSHAFINKPRELCETFKTNR